jgi:hypothetical protein
MLGPVERLRRPTSPDEAPAYLKNLAAALDRLGVEYGAEFLIAPLGAVNTDRVGPFNKGSDTSRLAALQNYPRSGTQRERILQVIEESGGGLTRDELAQQLHFPDSSVDPRVRELIDGGWIEESVETRPTRTGADAHILVPTAKYDQHTQARPVFAPGS